jgi:hypothetical protein
LSATGWSHTLPVATALRPSADPGGCKNASLRL